MPEGREVRFCEDGMVAYQFGIRWRYIPRDVLAAIRRRDAEERVRAVEEAARETGGTS